MTPPTVTNDKKLNVIYRVEPGCLGPTGAELVEDFCRFAQSRFDTQDTDIVVWNITPRFDKSLPELQYSITRKLLTREHAGKYLSLFNQPIDDFEAHVEELLVEFIDEFMDH